MVRHPAGQETRCLYHRWVLVIWRERGPSIPHTAGDPVMAANKDRVLEFLHSTFFDNAAALEG